jgi:hypothetical protein
MYTHKRSRLAVLLLVLITFGACQKNNNPDAVAESINQLQKNSGQGKQTKTFSSEPVIKWLEQQLNMFRLPLAAGATAPSSDRAFAYAGIALYQAVLPGMPSHRSMEGQLTDFPQMPKTEAGKTYHWAAAANAALAAINRSLFSGASAVNKQLMTDLETSLQAQYGAEADAQTIQRSVDFGRAVAAAVWTWAQTDGTASMPPASS